LSDSKYLAALIMSLQYMLLIGKECGGKLHNVHLECSIVHAAQERHEFLLDPAYEGDGSHFNVSMKLGPRRKIGRTGRPTF
jgi:hypothetical protein